MRSGRTLFKFHLVTNLFQWKISPPCGFNALHGSVDVLIGQGLVVAAILLLEGVRGLDTVVEVRLGSCRGHQTGVGQGQDSRGPGIGSRVVPIGGGVIGVHLMAKGQTQQAGEN